MVKNYFCKICMFNKKCKDICLVDDKSKFNSDNNIIWVNLNKSITETNLLKNKNIDEIEIIQPQDLFLVEIEKDFSFIYSPIAGRLFRVNNKLIEEKKTVIKFIDSYKKELVKSGLLLPKDLYESLYNKAAYVPTYSSALRIIFASGCTLNCTYCYADANRDVKKIDLKKLKSLINTFAEKVDLKTIEFHGYGEPTFNLEELKKVHALFKERFPDIKFGIQTNGQFNYETAKWLLDNNIGVGFSFDGPELIHNAQRPTKKLNDSSFLNIMRNFKFFNNNKKDIFIISTITAYSEKEMLNIYNFITKTVSCKQMLINPISECGRASITNPDIKEMNASPNLENFAENFAELLKLAFKDDVQLNSRIFADFANMPGSYNCHAVIPMLVVLPDGEIASCDELGEEQNSEDNIFRIGKISANEINIDDKKIEILRKRNIVNMKECSNCIVKWSCKGGCLVDCYIENKDIFKPYKKHCEIKLKIADEYFQFLINEMNNNYSLNKILL